MGFSSINYRHLLGTLWPTRVRSQLIFGVALVHLLLMAIFVFDLTRRQRDFMMAQSLEEVKSLAGTLASNSTSWVLSNDVTGLGELIGNIRQYQTVRYVMILDTEGKVLAHTDPSLLGKYVTDALSRSVLRKEPMVQVLLADSRSLDIAAPILTNTGKCLGWARIGHDRTNVAESLGRISRDGMIYTLLAILTGSLFAMLIGNRLTAGLNRLIAFTTGIKDGQRGLRLEIPSGYEVGRLAESFNQMLDAMEARGGENAELRHILDNMTEGCMIIGADWTYRYVNAAAARQRGRSSEELVGRELLEMSPDSEGNRIFAAYRRCMAERSNMRFESKYAFGDGGLKWYELRIEPVKAGVFVLSLDITARKKAEEEMRLSEDKFSKAFYSSPNLMAITAKADGRILEINDSYCGVLGYRREECLGHTTQELNIWADAAQRKRVVELVEKTARARDVEADLRKKSGEAVSVVLSMEPAVIGGEECFISVAVDVTARSRAEKEAAATHNLLRDITDNSASLIYAMDAEGRFLLINKPLEELFGVTREKVIGKTREAVLPAATAAAHRENDLKVLSGRKPVTVEEEAKAGGVKRTYLSVKFPLLAQTGEIYGVGGISADITRQKDVEAELQRINRELEERVLSRTEDIKKKSEALQAGKDELMKIVQELNLRTEELRRLNVKLTEVDRLKSMFIASMSHELRTPLNSIIGFSSILLKEWCGPVNVEQKENLSTVLAAGKHLHMLINDVIDVSKIEAGKMESVVEDFDLGDLIEEALALIRSERGGNGLMFSSVPVRQLMHTDRRRLLQCLINLLSNAAKFTPEGSVSIGARVIRDAGAGLAEITVADTGIGIKEEDIPRLFAPFVRLASPLTGKTRGTGLGLHLVKKIVTEILKGEIFVNSVYERGSSFGLRIPVRLEQEK